MYDTALELYNQLLEIYFDEYYYLLDAKSKKMYCKYETKKLVIKGYDYCVWSESKEESTDKEESADQEEFVDLSEMPPPEGDKEEVRVGKGIKVLTPNKLYTRLAILLAQIKAGNNS